LNGPEFVDVIIGVDPDSYLSVMGDETTFFMDYG
jgi:hypothetical protein